MFPKISRSCGKYSSYDKLECIGWLLNSRELIEETCVQKQTCRECYIVYILIGRSPSCRYSGYNSSLIINFSLPWIPVEYYGSLQRTTKDFKSEIFANATKDFKSEIFAYATTIWEIFSKGMKPPQQNVRVEFSAVKKSYCK